MELQKRILAIEQIKVILNKQFWDCVLCFLNLGHLQLAENNPTIENVTEQLMDQIKNDLCILSAYISSDEVEEKNHFNGKEVIDCITKVEDELESLEEIIRNGLRLTPQDMFGDASEVYDKFANLSSVPEVKEIFVRYSTLLKQLYDVNQKID